MFAQKKKNKHKLFSQEHNKATAKKQQHKFIITHKNQRPKKPKEEGKKPNDTNIRNKQTRLMSKNGRKMIHDRVCAVIFAYELKIVCIRTTVWSSGWVDHERSRGKQA